MIPSFIIRILSACVGVSVFIPEVYPRKENLSSPHRENFRREAHWAEKEETCAEKTSRPFNREGGWIGSKNIEPGSKNLKFKDFFEKFKPLNDLLWS